MLYVGPNGEDNRSGTRPQEALASIQVALDRAALGRAHEIRVLPGRYFGQHIRLDKKHAGRPDRPLVIRGVGEHKPVFDGGLAIDWRSATAAEDPLLPGPARGKVLQLSIQDPLIRRLLTSGEARMSQGDLMMRVARYPNIGFAHIETILDKGAVYAKGRTLGGRPESSFAAPIGGRFTVYGHDVSAWERELRRFQKAKVKGYLAHDWYFESHPIARASSGVVQLQTESRYGVEQRKPARRFYATNLLCELDAPGEFFYDETRHLLLFWPREADAGKTPLTVWAGGSMVVASSTSDIRIEGLVFQGVSSGRAVVDIQDSASVVLAGCVVRKSSRPGVLIRGGSACGILSCDLYDLPKHLQLDGGDTRTLKASKHFAKNCHFTQVDATDFYGRISLRGVGQVFRNNLVHNFSGQVMVVGGNDHLVERNELFNIGYAEGDGGAIYSGSQMWSWGNVYRQNFIHHLMCVPEFHPRGGIYPDDGDMGDTIEQNLFYKAAHRAVLINGGAGHSVNENIFLDGYVGIYNTEIGAQRKFEAQARYDRGELKRGDKDDMIYRTERAIGKAGWANPVWKEKYPAFYRIMSQEKMRFWPIECDFSRNYFDGNTDNIRYRVAGGDAGIKPIKEVPFITAYGNRRISPSVFKDAAALDFRYKSASAAKRLPDIAFESIGLHADEYRKHPPDPTRYRRLVAERFKGRPSYDPDAVYDPETIIELTYFNSGQLLMTREGQ
ncbi:MAG: right-handed parallel beta-helix repeat-containing protein [Planctomycetota bacterium]